MEKLKKKNYQPTECKNVKMNAQKHPYLAFTLGGKSMELLGMGLNLHVYSQGLFCIAISHTQFTVVE